MKYNTGVAFANLLLVVSVGQKCKEGTVCAKAWLDYVWYVLFVCYWVDVF